MHSIKLKKAGLLTLSVLIMITLPSCGMKKTVSEADVTETAETQPDIPEGNTAEAEEPGEIQGPKPQAGAGTENSGEVEEPDPAQEENTEEEDPEHHPEPPPGEEAVKTAEAGADTEGALSPPSESGSIFGGNQGTEAVSDPELSALLSSLPFPSGNGTWSAYVCDLEKNTEGSINEHQMQAASLIKLYIMGAVYENYDNLISQYGQGNVDSNLHAMITVSDNDAANALTGYLGGGDGAAGMAAVNAYCSANGYMNTHMGRLLLHSNEYDDNYTSAADCGHFLKKVYDGWMDGDSDATAMFKLLAAQERRNKIPAQMPSGVSVANKTGELSDVENDAGILYYSNHDLVIVFMSENLSEAGSAQNTIASLSRQIYDYYQ